MIWLHSAVCSFCEPQRGSIHDNWWSTTNQCLLITETSSDAGLRPYWTVFILDVAAKEKPLRGRFSSDCCVFQCWTFDLWGLNFKCFFVTIYFQQHKIFKVHQTAVGFGAQNRLLCDRLARLQQRFVWRTGNILLTSVSVTHRTSLEVLVVCWSIFIGSYFKRPPPLHFRGVLLHDVCVTAGVSS